jgi:hypothetical protein
MALETCNASVSHDIDGAVAAFDQLNLNNYPGEQVSDMANEALRLIKIMQGGYALPVSTGSRLLKKISATSSEEFNRKIYNLLDHVKTMEHKYKVLDPRSITKDPQYSDYGPIALVSTVHQLYGRLITDHDWPALATKLPQSNNAPANDGRYSRPSSRSGDDYKIKCFRCGGPHVIRDCPNKQRDRDKRAPPSTGDSSFKKPKADELPAWRYQEPKDLTKSFTDADGRVWKFCTKCVCRKSGKVGMYHTSHFDHEHRGSTNNESNMADVDVPLNLPLATISDPTMSSGDDDPVVFQGAWCTPVDAASAALAFPSLVERENTANVDDEADFMPLPSPPLDDQFVLDLLNHVTGHQWAIDPDTGEFFVPPAELTCVPFTLNPNAPAFIPFNMRSPGFMQFEYAHADSFVRRQLIHVNPIPAPRYLSPSEQLNPAFWPQPTSDATTNEEEETQHVDAYNASVDFSSLAALTACPSSVTTLLHANPQVTMRCPATSSLNTTEQPTKVTNEQPIAANDTSPRQAILSTFLPVWTQPLFAFLFWIGRFLSASAHTCGVSKPPCARRFFFSESAPADQIYQVQPHRWMQHFMIFLFWISMMVWEGISHFVHDIGRDANDFTPRRQRRHAIQQAKHHRHTRWSRLPTLVFLPILWMGMTNVIMFPGRSTLESPFATMGRDIYKSGQQAYQRISRLDEMVALNFRTCAQFNKMKCISLLNLVSPVVTGPEVSIGETTTSDPNVVSITHVSTGETATSGPIDQTQDESPDVIDTVDQSGTLQANGPTVLSSISEDKKTEQISTPATQMFDEPCAFMQFVQRERHPVIFDTGASLSITPDKSDFSGPITLCQTDLRLGGMANGLKIDGIGPITWTFANRSNDPVRIHGMAYYVPQAKARLLSPQRVFDAITGAQGRFEGDNKFFRLYFDGQQPLEIEYDERNSLPIGYATFHDSAPDITAADANLTLHSDENQNMTAGQKFLLQWHYRFGHLNLPGVQRILRAAPFVSGKFEAASKCDTTFMKCSICEYAKGHRRARHHVHQIQNDKKAGALKIEHLKPGAAVSVDHFESRLLGRTFDSYGKASSIMYKGGCIFVDHCSGYMHVEHQLGFSGIESIRAKQAYEQMALHSGVIVESYLTDSGAFKANAFVQHIREHAQRIHYCGANAHHKNGIAERAVRSVSNMARALILHASTHWKDGIDASLWPMAVTYATHLYNQLPNERGLCPADIFTGSTVPRHRLKDIHVWGCPVYILDPHLQGGNKIPRWQPRSRLGVFMGFSHLHSSEVPLVLNLQTGSITPQYHVVFDDLFSTVSSLEREIDPPDNWADLCLENSSYVPVESLSHDPSDGIALPLLDFEWLSPADHDLSARAITRNDAIRETMVPTPGPYIPPSALVPPSADLPLPQPPDLISDAPTYARISAPAVEMPVVPVQAPLLAPTVPPPVSVAISTTPFIRPVVSHDPPIISNIPGTSRSGRPLKKVTRYIEEAYLSRIPYHSLDINGQHAQLAYMAELYTCSDTGHVDITDPRVYAAKIRGSDADMPTFQQALNGSAASEYLTAMKLEIHTLMGQHTWETVNRPKNKSVLKGTWAFKLKRLPDGTPYRYKARFCARGDMQTEGVDFFETYAPVVQWSTIRLLLSIVLTEGWTTRQVDYTNAFAQAELKEEVYVECPRLFGPKSGQDKVLRLHKSLYGLRQAPRTFFEKLRAGLLERGWTQSLIDPCLFLKSGMMCVVYVDDTIFAAANIDDIEREIASLGISIDAQAHTFALRNEGEVSAFLGIQIEKKGHNEFLLTQTGLIDKILAATKMTECNGCDTPSTIDPLHTDKDGEPFNEEWAYDGIVGMLMYLSGNTRPDIAYAVHQAARFTHGARESHAAGIKRIVRYLQKTKTEGLILKPGPDRRVDCYVDADFGGLFSVEDKQDPISVKSRTGYVITYRDAPLMWASKMQTQVALSTMEAEYIALSQSMRDLIPIREVLKEIMTQVFGQEPKITYHSHSKAFEDTIGTAPHVIPQSTVYEDNDACLKFARMPKLTPRTKHIGTPYHWFRTQVEQLEIHIERIDTKDQLADQFTKGLPVAAFRLARKRLMGW